MIEKIGTGLTIFGVFCLVNVLMKTLFSVLKEEAEDDRRDE